MNTATQATSNKCDINSAAQRECQAMKPWEDLMDYARNYARKEPEVAACVCLGIGFILGWRLKPW